ncbi:MAG: alpha/beta fold hydrolase [Thermoanaerobaculia bacterium]
MCGDDARRVRPDWVPQSLYPFESRYMDLLGHRMHYVDEGEGPTLLLLHGNPTWSFLYRHLIIGLRSRFRCVAPDYPGFGLSRARPGYDFRAASQADAVGAFIQRLDLRGVIAFGQDWGGPIMLHAASRDPARFEGFVIGNTWGWPLDGDPHFERFARLLGGPVGGWAIRWFNAFVNWMIPLGLHRARLSRVEMDAYRGPFATGTAREATHVFPGELIAARQFLIEVESGLTRLRHVPALIVWGTRDFALRRRERERFEREFPNHETVLLDHAAHFIQEDAPGEIARAILRRWPGRAAGSTAPLRPAVGEGR